MDFKSKSDDNLLDEIASELFKLNDINSRKMEEANWTVKMFSISLIFLGCFFVQFILVQI